MPAPTKLLFQKEDRDVFFRMLPETKVFDDLTENDFNKSLDGMMRCIILSKMKNAQHNTCDGAFRLGKVIKKRYFGDKPHVKKIMAKFMIEVEKGNNTSKMYQSAWRFNNETQLIADKFAAQFYHKDSASAIVEEAEEDFYSITKEEKDKRKENRQIAKATMGSRLMNNYHVILKDLLEQQDLETTQLLVLCKKFFEGNEKMIYTTSSTRLYNPLQNLSKDVRKVLFAKWHDYDISACAPTLLSQMVDMETPVIDYYLKNKDQIRQWLADLLGMTKDHAKEIINALFFGVTASAAQLRWDFRRGSKDRRMTETGFQGKLMFRIAEIFAEYKLEYNTMIDKFDQIEWIQDLKEEIKAVSNEIANKVRATAKVQEDGSIKIFSPFGHQKILVSWKKKQVMSFMFMSAERKILDVMSTHLESSQNHNLLIHDGFISKEPVNTKELESEIEQFTGFKVKLSHQVLGASSSQHDESCAHSHEVSGERKLKNNNIELIGDHNVNVILLVDKFHDVKNKCKGAIGDKCDFDDIEDEMYLSSE